ncbi:MAG: adenylate/guanylate cyclase domain-containing protein [Gemmatimonadota bacterium]
MVIPRLLSAPDTIPRRDRRFYVLARIGLPIALMAHVGMLGAFTFLGQRELALFNLLSVLLYVTTIVAHAGGTYRPLGGPVVGEIWAHAVLCGFFLGIDPGFHFYLLMGVFVPFLVPFWSKWLQWSLAFIFAATFGVIAVGGQFWTPLSPLDAYTNAAFMVANTVGIALVLAAVVLTYDTAVVSAERALEAAYQRTEDLLHNILPERIAARLKFHHETVAEAHPDVTILFADLVGFTPLSQKLSPGDLLELLNLIFSRFDELVGHRGIEKVKTIGDAYMVVAGAPDPRPDHAAQVALLALEMTREVEVLARETGYPLALRMGISSGEVVAGVIGSRRFAYDLWGDAVNTAARMEAFGVSGQIQITEETLQLLKGDARFIFESRPPMEVKGKGRMQTYLLYPGPGLVS